MAKKAKELRESRGILASTTLKSGKKLPQETTSQVIDFFNSDLYGRIMPGRKDVVSIKMGERIGAKTIIIIRPKRVA